MNDESGGHLQGKPKLTQYARSRRVGSLLFLAGVSSRRSDDTVKGASTGPTGAPQIDIREQTEGCIENLQTALSREGLDISCLVDVTVFLVSMADYGGFNEVWNRYFDASGPARTTVAVHQLPDPQLAIELKAIAAFA
ncbi:MAG TPA: RidA family protein [Myxococcota bacterium]|nr:RidA family protein [Myxococcota bacterium]